jgi:hypothetical protein
MTLFYRGVGGKVQTLSFRPHHPTNRPSISPDFSFRSICRSSDCVANRRKSCPRLRGHVSPANAPTGARNIFNAICHESADNSLAFPARCTQQNNPSA